MAFALFENKDKKNTKINNYNKTTIIDMLTKMKMSCSDLDLLTLLSQIIMELQSQPETSSVDVMCVDVDILEVLRETNNYVLQKQFALAGGELQKVSAFVSERNNQCTIGGRKTKADEKIEKEALKIMKQRLRARAKTGEDELKAQLRQLESTLNVQEAQKAKFETAFQKAPTSASLKAEIASLAIKVAGTKKLMERTEKALEAVVSQSVLQTVQEDSKSLADKTTEAVVGSNVAAADIAAQEDVFNSASVAVSNVLGSLSLGGTETATGATSVLDVLGSSGSAPSITTVSMPSQSEGSEFSNITPKEVEKEIQALERRIEFNNNKIEDSNDDMRDVVAELSALLQRRKTASPLECLTIDGQVDQFNAKKNSIMNTIKRYRNENATITDSIGMLERLKTQLEINMQKEKVRQLTGGKFLDMEGLSMYLKSAIEKANEDLENVGLAVTVAESADIEMNSASASYGSIAESALEKDDHKYDDLEKEIGLMI